MNELALLNMDDSSNKAEWEKQAAQEYKQYITI